MVFDHTLEHRYTVRRILLLATLLNLYVFFLQEIDDTDSCLDDSQEAYEGNKDAARAILRVKQKLDGYEDGEMRSVQGQVLSSLYWSIKIFIIYTPVTKVKFIFMFAF